MLWEIGVIAASEVLEVVINVIDGSAARESVALIGRMCIDVIRVDCCQS